MLWCSLIELDSLLSIIMIIIYGLFSLRSKQIYLGDVYLFCRLFPLLFVVGFYLDSAVSTEAGRLAARMLGEAQHTSGLFDFVLNVTPSIDVLLAILLFFIMYNFNSFESVLLLLFAFVGQYYMLHSMDLLSFYIALEAQNFCFLVLCGLPTVRSGGFSQNHSFSVEASLKYFLLSAFSSGVILFWFSTLYLQTGLSVLLFKSVYTDYGTSIHSFQILCAMMFKLGAAPLHLWVVQIYNGVKRNLLMYISTAPKLSLFGFWVGSFHQVWTDYSLLLFSIFSIALGSFGAYSQPGLRSLFAYSTVNEIGLLLAALETAGFHSLFQHLGIYIISQILLWNIEDKRLFSIAAVSLAGMPPLAGFFGKAFIFWHVSNTGLYSVLLAGLFCTAISLVYYLRVLRLFWNRRRKAASKGLRPFDSSSTNTRLVQYNRPRVICSGMATGFVALDSRIMLTSSCVVLLFVIPFFLIKPFVL